MASGDGKKAFDWHWADETLKGMEDSRRESPLWRVLKVALYFADEAAILLVILYLAWRFLS